jgi:hypothetical protein
VNSALIKKKYEKLVTTGKAEDRLSNDSFQQEGSVSVSEINVNNLNLEKILKRKKDLSVNPYVLNFQPKK